MRFSDIKVRHIYNVRFDPVENCEFNGKHLALVLKENNDKQTFVVMPLTTSSNGVESNKYKVGKISTLPSSLKGQDTYAVLNQIRTVNSGRFIALKEGHNRIDVCLEDILFIKLLALGINDLSFNLSQNEKIDLFKGLYEMESIIKAKDLAYNILKLKKNQAIIQEEISRIEEDIMLTLKNVPNILKHEAITDDIKNILSSIIPEN